MPLSPEQREHVAERQRRAYELHIAGATYAQIADQLEYASASGAHQAVQSELGRQVIDADDEIPSELARLDAMLVGLWPKARRGDVHAIDRVLKIGERRASLLTQHMEDNPPEREETGLDEFTRRLRDRGTATKRVDQPGAS